MRCSNAPIRKVAPQVSEEASGVARETVTTARSQQSQKNRNKVEMLFA
jgi:hypothetical protein